MIATAAKITAVPPAYSQSMTDLEREFDDFVLAHARLSWSLAMELVAEATGLPAGRALIGASAAPLAGTLARRLGHSSVRSFITSPGSRYGLNRRWGEFVNEISALVYMRRYELKLNSPAAILKQVDIVSRQLNRPPEHAAEFHQVMQQRLRHQHAAEKTRREQVERTFGREKAAWKKGLASRDAMEAELKASLAEYRQACEGLQAELNSQKRATESLMAEVEGSNNQIAELINQRDEERLTLQDAEQRIAYMMSVMDEVLEGRSDELFNTADELAALKQALANSRTAARTSHHRCRALSNRNAKLHALCAKRAAAMERAVNAIRQLKAEAARAEQCTRRWKRIAGVLTVAASILAVL